MGDHTLESSPIIQTMGKADQRRLLSAILRCDLASFIIKCFFHLSPDREFMHNWHIDVIAEHLCAVSRGEIKRLIISMPPRHLKSICANVSWPSWIMGHNPESKIITASYSRDLSAKHTMDARSIMGSEWYRRIFPTMELSREQNSKYKIKTTKNGVRISSSVDSAITGEGGDYIVIDDPHNPAHIFSAKKRTKVIDWFESVIMSRLDDRKKGGIVIIMHRLHKDDLAGWLLSRGSVWTYLDLPIIFERHRSFGTSAVSHTKVININKDDILHPQRYSRDDIAQIKFEAGTYVFASQYMQNPIDMSGNPIKLHWLARYREPPKGPVIISWDTASQGNGSYSVGSVWTTEGNKRFLLDIIRGRWDYQTLKQNVISSYNKWNAVKILIENKSSGQQLMNDLPPNISLIAINPTISKEERVLKIVGLFEKGLILLPENASWLFDLEYELSAFPSAKHNDQVDSISQYLNWSLNNKTQLNARIRRL